MRLDGWFRDLKLKIRGLEIKFVENYFLLENYVTSEREPFLRMFLYYQPLPITRYQIKNLSQLLVTK